MLWFTFESKIQQSGFGAVWLVWNQRRYFEGCETFKGVGPGRQKWMGWLSTEKYLHLTLP